MVDNNGEVNKPTTFDKVFFAFYFFVVLSFLSVSSMCMTCRNLEAVHRERIDALKIRQQNAERELDHLKRKSQ